MIDQRLHLFVAALLAAGAAACVESDPLLSVKSKADRTLDLSGSDQPAGLETHEDSAKASVALVRIVTTAALVIGEVGSAAGDLFPSEDNPCPGGGSASSEIGGSFANPRLHMMFSNCVRGDYILDGQATITCEDLNGSSCPSGSIYIGEGSEVLHFQHPLGVILMRGNSDISADEATRHLHAVSTLQGEMRSPGEEHRYSFITENLTLDLRDTADNQTEVRVDGVAGTGGGAAAANCAQGRFDTETPEAPLVFRDDAVRSGFLRFFSPPPRPGTQQAEALFGEAGVDIKGADGGQKFYTVEELATYCAV